MSRIRGILAVGLLMGGTGCANLQRSSMLQPPHQHDHTTAAGPIDPFHPPVESTGTRISRFFPGLARHENSAPPVVESMKRGGNTPVESDRDLRAVPRPEPDFGDASSASVRADGTPRVARTRLDALPGVTAAENEPVPEAKSDLPLLTTSIVAEVEPQAAPTRATVEIEPARTREQHEARVAAAALSPRRMPPMPELDPRARRPLPPRLPVAERREGLNEQDSQTRLARGRDEDSEVPAAEEGVKPLLAVADVLPPTANPGALNPAEPTPVEEPKAAEEPKSADQPLTTDPVPVEPVGDPIADAPPVIEEAAPAPPQTPAADVAEQPAQDEPRDEVAAPERRDVRSLLGRPRMPRGQARRGNLPPDVPAVSFPKTYYGQDPLPRDKFPLDEQTEPGRWTWRPRLLKRLRGE